MIFSNLVKYHLWANNLAREIINKLTEEEFSKDFGKIIGSVRDKVEHIVLALETCFAFLKNDWIDYEKTVGKIKTFSMNELIEYWVEKDKELSRKLNKIDFKPVIIQRKGENDYFKMNGDDFILQYILHTVYHRGQLNYCLRALNKERIEADYIYYFDELNQQ
ncbi:MAG: DinB family protein [Candidatus Hodarchaeota archaeon]